MARKLTSGSAAVALVRKSELVPLDQLNAFLAGVETAILTGDEVIARMETGGLLTGFQAHQLRAGRWRGFRLGNYRILERIGAGGSGHVFLAEHVLLGRRVAVKVLTPDRTPETLARFLREAQAGGQVKHQNLVHVYDCCVDSAPPYIAMEYIDGLSLQAAVSRAGTLHPGDVAAVGLQLANGLQAVHMAGLVHRDVKPANVLIDRRGVVRLLDLGIVLVATDLTDSRLTEEGGILGTIDYLAPEQATDGAELDTRADVYGLGGTLYFLLAGQPPFQGGSPASKLLRVRTEPPPLLRALRPDCPPGLAAVVHQMLAKRPIDRPESPAEAAEMLARFAAPTADWLPTLFGATTRTVAETDGPGSSTATPPVIVWPVRQERPT